jgi:plasmid replication initiation protein
VTNDYKNNLVVKGNPLNEIQLNLSLIEYKFVITCISRLNKDDKEFGEIEISVREFADLLGLKSDGLYGDVKKAVYSLGSKALGIIELETGDYVVRAWFEEIRYIKNTGIVKCTFNNRLRPFLLYMLIKKGYTKYLLRNIINMKSRYSIKIYEFLKQYENLKVVTYDISKFKSFLGIENKYNKYAQLKLRVLEPANREMFEYADIYFTYSEIKNGRSVTHLKFLIHENKKINEENIEYKRFNKKYIINLIIEKMDNDYNQKFTNKFLNKYHRFYLIEFHKSLHNINPSEIRVPLAFLKWKLAEIVEMYDSKTISEKYEDY